MNSTAQNERLARGRVPQPLRTADTMLALGSVVALLVGALYSGTHRPDVSVTQSIVVDCGDSLWALAAEHPVTGLSTAQTADLIAEMNHVSADEVSPGIRLVVPGPLPDPATVAMR